MRIRSIMIACSSGAAAKALAEEYAWIGIRTRRDGRWLTVTTLEEI